MNDIQLAISTFAQWIKAAFEIFFSSDNILLIMVSTGCIIITIWEILSSFLHTKDD